VELGNKEDILNKLKVNNVIDNDSRYSERVKGGRFAKVR